jgi:hypothetical protein
VSCTDGVELAGSQSPEGSADRVDEIFEGEQRVHRLCYVLLVARPTRATDKGDRCRRGSGRSTVGGSAKVFSFEKAAKEASLVGSGGK